MTFGRRPTAILACSALLVVTCGKDDGDESGTATDSSDFCANAPVVTWDTFGHGFMIESCQPCHASNAQDRYDAPEQVIFDTEADVMVYTDRILSRATGDAPTMPPEGGVSEDDRYYLEVWLRCYPPAG